MRSRNPSPVILKAALALAIATVSLVCGIQAAGAEVGVAAAVNVDARSKAPGSGLRVLALGQKVVYDEQISTDSNGQAQILLLDGTTFTVGPNSNITIDKFVFNPDTGGAQVVASVTKGAFRFIGAKTSQTAGGVTINTPVGTIGVRGGSVVCGMSGGQFICMMPFGKNVEIAAKDGSTHTIYKPGWLLAFDAQGNYIETRKATPQEIGAITAALNGKGNGGTGTPPGNGTVANSQVPDNNSNLPDVIPVSVLMEAVKSNPQIETIIDNAVQQDVNNSVDQPEHDATGFFSGLSQPSIEGEAPDAFMPYSPCGDGCGEGETNLSVHVAGSTVTGAGSVHDTEFQYPSDHSSEYPYSYGQNPVIETIDIDFGNSTAAVTSHSSTTVASTATDTFIVSGRSNPVPGLVQCTNCDFIDWGYWGTRITTPADPDNGVPQSREDYIGQGTWVAGDVSAPIDPNGTLPFGGTVVYEGNAIGKVALDGDGSIETYAASGDFRLDYSFSDREGYASISNFTDGSHASLDVAGSVEDTSNATQALFGGGLYGGGDSNYISGTIQGAFVDDGATVAAGAIGTFSFQAYGLNAVGTVAGVGGPPSN